MLNLLVIAFFMSWSLTWCMRQYAIAKHLLDVPNHRSSHQTPTPRGGGVAFVAVFLIIILCLSYLNIIIWSNYIAIMLAGLFIAFIGFCDDRSSLSARWRFIGHFSASIFVLYCMKKVPAITFYTWTLAPGYVAAIFFVFYLVWMLNLYNFMDGIDGLAAVEAITICFGIGILYWYTGHYHAMTLVFILAVIMSGFLYWNFPPARIFMGDAGSGFLGFILGVLSIQSISMSKNFFWSWLILLGFFIVDATFTLLTRLTQRERIYTAHRNHAYQHAASIFKSHLSVTLGVGALNIFWLWPLAMLVGMGYINGLIGLVTAYCPLCILVWQFEAGNKCFPIVEQPMPMSLCCK